MNFGFGMILVVIFFLIIFIIVRVARKELKNMNKKKLKKINPLLSR